MHKREITFPSKYQAAHKINIPEKWDSSPVFRTGILKGNRNRHSLKQWAWQSIILFYSWEIWKPFRRKSFLINVFNLNWLLLRYIFQYLLFFSEKKTETVTTHENGCSNLFFHVIRLVREHFFEKIFFQSYDSYSNIFAVKTLIYQYFYSKS